MIWLLFGSIGIVMALLVRWLVPSKQAMSVASAMLVGVAGAMLGAIVTSAIRDGSFDQMQSAAVVGSVVGASLVTVLVVLAGRATAPASQG